MTEARSEARMAPPVQVRGAVLSTRRVGAYHHLALVAPGIAEHTRPGQFVALAVGGPDTALVLRRAFSIYRVSTRGVYGGTVEIVFAAHGAGTQWLAAQPQHTPVDVVGPLGRPFTLPGRQQPGERHARRRRLRQRAVVRPRRAAAQPRLPGRLRPRRSHPGPALRCAGRQADGLLGGDHHRRRLGRDTGRGDRRAPGCPAAQPDRRGLRLRADGDARGGHRGRQPTTACPRSALSRSRWPAASACA